MLYILEDPAIWAASWENLCSGFPTRPNTNRAYTNRRWLETSKFGFRKERNFKFCSFQLRGWSVPWFSYIYIENQVMHQSFVSTAPSGPGISGAFNFSIFKAPLKALLSGSKIVVKSPLKAPPSQGLTIMKNNKWPESVALTFPAYPIVIPHKRCLHWSYGFREKFERTHIHRHIHTFTRKPSVFNICTCLPNTTAESCSR